MTTFFLSLGIIGLAVLGMAIGTLTGRGPIKGSCGGLACGAGSGCAGCPKATTERSPE